MGQKTLPTSCADCVVIWEPKSSRTLGTFPGLYRDRFTFYFMFLYLPDFKYAHFENTLCASLHPSATIHVLVFHLVL